MTRTDPWEAVIIATMGSLPLRRIACRTFSNSLIDDPSGRGGGRGLC